MFKKDSARLEHPSSSNFTPQIVPDMKMVVWNGDHYFMILANLWANLFSSDPLK